MEVRARVAAAALVLIVTGACGEIGGEPERAGESAVSEAAKEVPERQGDEVRVVVLGDSLTAGPGLAAEAAYPALLEEELERRGYPVEVVNAGASGDTTAGGLRRLDWILSQRPDIVVVELGVNDALRGQDLDRVEENLRRIVARSRAAGSRVLLVGLRIPPSYGEPYASRFRSVFPRLARELDVPLVPFLLDGVGGRPELNLADGVHPNARGHAVMAETVLLYLEPLVRQEIGSRERR